MEDFVVENDCAPLTSTENEDLETADSSQNFQKFMLELFEKNGVINDLRAYLRGHIVGLLRSTRTGDVPICQKNFIQRLELPNQAMNMLLAEYLMRMEFNYTLSVFISEIPLANMVFEFAKSLLQGQHKTGLKFIDEDVWSILNCLGVKCDSECASNVVEIYRKKELPLLICLIQCMPLFKEPVNLNNTLSEASLSSSDRFSESQSSDNALTCKHASFCKTCRGNIRRIKYKYRNKKKIFTKNIKDTSLCQQNMDFMMRNIDVLETSVIDEMFEQLKSVYETEIKIVKSEEERRVKRSLTDHAMQLQKKRVELEEKFRIRESELQRNIESKKRFLWGLAKLLREQHKHLGHAMRGIQEETNRLTVQETSLKSQLEEAQQILRERGEQMRVMIAQELAVLEQHLESVKKERDTISKERSELAHLKQLNEKNANKSNLENDDIQSPYELMKSEFDALKSYLKMAKLEPKCVMERGTITDWTEFDGVLNNGQDVDRRAEGRVNPKRVVNDLTKLKNVNFNQLKLTETFEQSRDVTAPSDISDVYIQRLKEENERLKIFSTQQREHIDELSSQQARLTAELTAVRLQATTRPRTAPPLVQRSNTSDISQGFSWKKGAGEEMNFFVESAPRIVVPGDTVPFIGIVNRHADNRRYLINQWRLLRRRHSPVGVGKTRTNNISPNRDMSNENISCAGPSCQTQEGINSKTQNNQNAENYLKQTTCETQGVAKISATDVLSNERDKMVELVGKGAIERVKTKEHTKAHHKIIKRELSPSSVLRDAKLRLRKLEIEAEAVEKSYLDFRRKQKASKCDRQNTEENVKNADLKRDKSPYPKPDSRKTKRSNCVSTAPTELIVENIDEYKQKYAIGNDFCNRIAKFTSILQTDVIENVPNSKSNPNFVDAPLQEFRKYYLTDTKMKSKEFCDEQPGSYLTKKVDNGDFSKKSKIVCSSTLDCDYPLTSPKNCEMNVDTNSSLNSVEQKSHSKSPRKEDSISISNNSENSHQTGSSKTKSNLKSSKTRAMTDIEQKKQELEILKQNISKIYNLPEKAIEDNEENNETVKIVKSDFLSDVKETGKSSTEVSWHENSNDASSHKILKDETLHNTEVLNEIKRNDEANEMNTETEINGVKEMDNETQNVSQPANSMTSIDDSEINYEQNNTNERSIETSPKHTTGETQSKQNSVNSDDNVMSAKNNVTELINAVYDSEQIENMNLALNKSKDSIVPFVNDADEYIEYPDDFTDENNLMNSNSQRDSEKSPISMAEESDDENFWDS